MMMFTKHLMIMHKPHTVGEGYTLYQGYAHLGSGLACGLAGLAAGMAIGIVGDSGVRYVRPPWGLCVVAYFVNTGWCVYNHVCVCVQLCPHMKSSTTICFPHLHHRANAQQPKLYVGMILILIFAEALALYGLIGTLLR